MISSIAITLVGTGMEIVDDYQRLDPELAAKLGAIRLGTFIGGEFIPTPGARDLLSNQLTSEFKKVVKEEFVMKAGTKIGEFIILENS